MRAGCASEESPLNHPGILRVSDNAGIAISQTYGVAVDAVGTPPLTPWRPRGAHGELYPPWVCRKVNVPPSRARGSAPRPGGGGPNSRRHHEPREDVDSASGGLLAGL